MRSPFSRSGCIQGVRRLKGQRAQAALKTIGHGEIPGHPVQSSLGIDEHQRSVCAAQEFKEPEQQSALALARRPDEVRCSGDA